MLNTLGWSLEDILQIRDYEGLREIAHLEKVPLSDLTTVFQIPVCASAIDAILLCSIKHGLDVFQPGVI
jgi:hypothetical protein